MPILIVDDSPAVGLALAAVLGEAGYADVRLAGAAAEASRLLEAAPADLILMDGRTPDTDGLAACRQIRARDAWRHIPILLITGDDTVEVRRAAREAGAAGWLIKPPAEGELLRAVSRALAAAA